MNERAETENALVAGSVTRAARVARRRRVTAGVERAAPAAARETAVS